MELEEHLDESSAAALPRRESLRLQRRQAIITVATRSFLDHGYAATSMSSIAAAVGGSKGTLWSHFSSKDDLFSAVLEDRTEAFRRNLSAPLDPDNNLHDAIRSFCCQFIAKLISPEAIALHRLVISECARFPQTGTIFYERAQLKTLRLMASFLTLHMEKGGIRQCDAMMAARTLMSLCSGGSQQEILRGASYAVERIETDADFIADVFMRAFTP
ncbi:TetR/AcrR family transcriptional regulator [Sphingobium boeckii]|nr:TetR/AcrR family transcriptional regulator [Sphingobium boeckii]